VNQPSGLVRLALVQLEQLGETDVIVCDLASAEVAGREFIAKLQQLHVRLGRSVPAGALVPPGARGRAAGFQMHLMKPVDGDELRAAVLEMARR
jgi:CheY-like chemotaxis protein